MATGRAAVRQAAKAGTWYVDNTQELDQQLELWLQHAARAKQTLAEPVKAIIAPHAGYSYSGPTAAFAYCYLRGASYSRVFVLGPSHHVPLAACALSPATHCETPLGALVVDVDTVATLLKTGLFETIDLEDDENEHSLEMHYPYIKKCLPDTKIVPIMVGHVNSDALEAYGKVLAPYLEDPNTAFVVSSDFCHWGRRFSYTLYEPQHGEICQFIEYLDRQAMDIISGLDREAFSAYLKKTKNTICGRMPIMALLNAVAASSTKWNLRFVKYAQSSKCRTKNDSSVSYASAILSQ